MRGSGVKIKSIKNLYLIVAEMSEHSGDERTVKFFSRSPVLSDKIESVPVLIRKIFENHQSDPVLIHQYQIMYLYFAS